MELQLEHLCLQALHVETHVQVVGIDGEHPFLSVFLAVPDRKGVLGEHFLNELQQLLLLLIELHLLFLQQLFGLLPGLF